MAVIIQGIGTIQGVSSVIGDVNFTSNLTSNIMTANTLLAPSKTSATRSNTTQSIIFNTTTGNFEGFNGSNWISFAGSGVGAARTTVNAYATLANGATSNVIVTGFRSYALYNITTSNPAWVRLYTNDANRLKDSTRTIGTDPLLGSGCIAEVVTYSSNTVTISPAIIGYNDEFAPSTNITMAITNTGNVTANIKVTLTLLQLEA